MIILRIGQSPVGGMSEFGMGWGSSLKKGLTLFILYLEDEESVLQDKWQKLQVDQFLLAGIDDL